MAVDGDILQAGQRVAERRGPARDILIGERTLLNVLCHLSGIATRAAEFTKALEGTKARIYDTRKTLPGWRRLQKYAVTCGGGRNHRLGVYDAVLIKDNHLCFGTHATAGMRYDIAEAVSAARSFASRSNPSDLAPIIQVEVDSLEQLREVLSVTPDIVLLDNMSLDQLKIAVRIRDEQAPDVALEASGGINLSSVRAVAETGVERISAGALTHSVTALDLALDWVETA